MKSKPFHYSFVAWGRIIVAEYRASSVDFTNIAIRSLEVIPQDQNLYSFSCNGFTFNYLTERGFTYMVIASEDIGVHIPFNFLESVKAEFQRSYGGRRASTWSSHNLDSEFGAILKVQMDFRTEHPQEMDGQIPSSSGSPDSNARSKLRDSIYRIPNTGHNTDVEDLVVASTEFYEAQKRRRRRGMKNKIVMFVLFMSLLTGIWLIHKLAE